MTRIYHDRRPPPPGVITEDYTEDVELGVLKRGKEADVLLVERIAPDRSCLLARKRFVRADSRAFRNKAQYTSHRRVQGTVRDGDRMRLASRGRAEQKALDGRTGYGRELEHSMWVAGEFQTLQRLYQAQAPVPYPVAPVEDGFLMEYIGDDEYAAPRLAQARLAKSDLPDAWEQIREAVLAFARAGIVHADLSAYNVLVWEGRLTVIDVPQAVPFLSNLDATDMLHRDVANVGAWFDRRGLEVDIEGLFVDALSILFDVQTQDSFSALD